ncbi:MAG TPA: hypothetical protein VGJ14_01450 [Sporichthyaceae bacterium]|jgi:Fe-S cluster assembly iron-binding protein IscA
MNLTETARNAVHALTVDSPNNAGLRIATGESHNGQHGPVLTLSVAAGPQPDDQVLNEQGARVFLEPDAAYILEAQTLDAEMDEAHQVSFFVR